MADGFIKLFKSETARWLQEKYPNAFLLLCTIAQRARREPGGLDGLEPGECFIGDYRSSGIDSEKKYRSAKEKLVAFGMIEVVETCRSRKGTSDPKCEKVKKSATSMATISTTRGTKVKLLNNIVWDANLEIMSTLKNERKGDLNDDQGVTARRPKGEEQEGIRRNKKEKEASPLARSLGECFFTSLSQHIPEYRGNAPTALQCMCFDKLLKQYSAEELQKAIIWAHTTPFWRPHVHTLAKLFKHFTTLLAQSNETQKKSSGGIDRKPKSQDVLDNYKDLV